MVEFSWCYDEHLLLAFCLRLPVATLVKLIKIRSINKHVVHVAAFFCIGKGKKSATGSRHGSHPASRVSVAAPTVSIMSDPGGHFSRSHEEFVSSPHRSLKRSQRDPRGSNTIK